MRRFIWTIPIAILLIGLLVFHSVNKQSDSAKLEKNFLWGQELFEEGKWDLAARQFEKDLVINPQTLQSHLQLAILYEDYLNQKDKAIEHYKAYIEIAPDNEKTSLVREWLNSAEQDTSQKPTLKTDQNLKEKPENKEHPPLVKENPETIKEKLDQQSQTIQKLEETLNEKENEIKELHSQIQNIQLQKNTQAKSQAGEQEYKDAKVKLDQQSVTIQRMQETINLKEKNIQQLKTDIHRIQSEKLSQEKSWVELSKAKKDLEGLQTELVRTNRDFGDAKKLINVLQKEKESLQSQMVKISQSNQDQKNLQMELLKSKKDLNDAFERIENLQKDRDLLQEKIIQTSNSKTELEQRLKEMEKDQNDQANLINFKYQNYLTLMNENKKLNARIKNYAVKEYRLNAQIKSLKLTNESLKTQQYRKKYTYESRSRATMKRYRVKKGESLRTIATAIYGDKEKWRLIYNVNRSKIPNPDILTPGQILQIPSD
jgi:nucleoid-associated protein YgaU